jgi:hypothetical protein
MARRSFALPLTALIAGVIGLGVGLYLGSTEEAKEFRDLVQSSISAIKGGISPEAPAPEPPSTGAPQAKDSEETKKPPETAEPTFSTDQHNGADAIPSNPSTESVGAQPTHGAGSESRVPVIPGTVSEPKPPATPATPAKPLVKKTKPKSGPKASPKRSHENGRDIPPPSAPEMNPFQN